MDEMIFTELKDDWLDFKRITRCCYGREIPWDGTAQTTLLWIMALIDLRDKMEIVPGYVQDVIAELLAEVRFQVPKVYSSTEG